MCDEAGGCREERVISAEYVRQTGAGFPAERNISVWDIALRAASIQTKQMRIQWPVEPAFHTGERKRPAWCSPKTEHILRLASVKISPPIKNIQGGKIKWQLVKKSESD